MSHAPDSFFFRLTNPADPSNFIISCELLPVYSRDHFVYLRAKMKATKFYGFGERNGNFSFDFGRYSSYSYDNPDSFDDLGVGIGKNRNS